MKRTKPMLCMAAALTLGMAACSDDINNSGGNGGVLEADEVRYLQVAISDAHAGTRAASFDPGTAEENTVSNVSMVFYDQAGNFIYKATPPDITWNPSNGSSGTADNVEKKGTATVKVTLKKQQNLPAYVVCFINPTNWPEKEPAMGDLRITKRPAYKDGSGNFAMSNSTYYGTNALTGEEDVKISGTPIPQDYLLKTMPDGTEQAGTVKTLDIYVERYAAKVQFTMETGSGSEATQEGVFPCQVTTKISDSKSQEYTLMFTPEAWTVNADAPEMFVIKNFSSEIDGLVPTKTQVQQSLGSWTGWNDGDNFRSYWSCSPAFFATSFPQVSDQIVDKVAQGTGAGTVVSPYALKYYSYDQIISGGVNKFAAEGADGSTLPTTYAIENTVGKGALQSLNPKAAVPSVLVVGKYSVKLGDTNLADGTTFYIRSTSSSSELLFGETFPTGVTAENGVKVKDRFISAQQILYVYDSDRKQYTLLNSANGSTNIGVLTVKHPSQEVRGENLVPQRYVTLQLTGAGTGLYYRPGGDGSYTPVTPTNLNAVNTLLWQQCGIAEAYTQGKCYYSIPIHHLRISEDTNDSPVDASGKIDWKKLRVGDLGLVRNHVYKINVKAIKGMATGIENLRYPIVPPMDADDYYVKYQINILGWRVVPKQENIIL